MTMHCVDCDRPLVSKHAPKPKGYLRAVRQDPPRCQKDFDASQGGRVRNTHPRKPEDYKEPTEDDIFACSVCFKPMIRRERKMYPGFIQVGNISKMLCMHHYKQWLEGPRDA